jgi:chromosome segregation ATPase
MGDATGPISTVLVALISALVTYLLGRRSQQQKSRNGVLQGWEGLTRGLREELARVRAELVEARAKVDTLERELDTKQEHHRTVLARERARWREERAALVRALRGDGPVPDDL